jgi:hypothetical protein
MRAIGCSCAERVAACLRQPTRKHLTRHPGAQHVKTTPRVLTTTGLSAVIFTIARHQALCRPHVRFSSERRYWTRLATPAPFIDSVDISLLTWLPDQGTALHDHGDAAGAFRVVQGE